MQAFVLKLLEEVNPSKSAVIDNLAGKFLKEGAPALASPITDLCNLSISLSSFPVDFKIAKLKPLYKKEAKTKPKTIGPIGIPLLIAEVLNDQNLFTESNLANWFSSYVQFCSGGHFYYF